MDRDRLYHPFGSKLRLVKSTYKELQPVRSATVGDQRGILPNPDKYMLGICHVLIRRLQLDARTHSWQGMIKWPFGAAGIQSPNPIRR